MSNFNIFISFLESIHNKNQLITGIIEAAEVIENMGIDIKSGANVDNLNRSILDTIPIVKNAYQSIVGKSYTPTITSGNDGKHKPNSKHYKDLALDWRTNDISREDAEKVEAILKKELGDQYFVDFEYPDAQNQHIHIQARSTALAPHSEEYYKQEEERRGQSLIRHEKTDKQTDRNILIEVARALKIQDPQWLYNLINFESRWDPNAKNPVSSARGLIQFIDSTARELGYESSEDLVNKNPTIEQQLAGPVYEYLKKYAPFPTEHSLYMAVFYPKARKWDIDQEFPEHVTKVNPGIYTVADYVNKVRERAGDSPIQVAKTKSSNNREEIAAKVDGKTLPHIMKSADRDGFKKYAREIVNVATAQDLDPALALSYVHNASGYDSGKEIDNRQGLMQIRKDILEKLKIDSSDTTAQVKSGIKLLKKYINEFGTIEGAIAALKLDPSIINDSLVNIDTKYATSRYPRDKWGREGIYKGKKRTDLPPVSDEREQWSLLKQELIKKGKQGEKVIDFVDDVIKYSKLYKSFTDKLIS